MSITVSGTEKRVAAIIAEYNPFHNGHKYHIEKTRSLGVDYVIAVMSGATVQRGDIAVYDKHFRAKTAIEGGVDLVIELPYPYSCSSAEDFAKGAVSIISRLGIVDCLSFGCESNDKDLLIRAADIAEALKDDGTVKNALSGGMSYPSAVSYAAEKLYGCEISSVLETPNNTLAIEYIRSLKNLNCDIDILPVKRTGSAHDSQTPDGSIASASYIRSLIRNGNNYSQYVPYEISDIAPADINNMSTAILLSLSSCEKLSEMLSYDVYQRVQAILKASDIETFDELVDSVKCKNLTRARISRELLCAYINILHGSVEKHEAYARVLAFNEDGKQLIKNISSVGNIKISSSLAELSDFSPSLCALDNITSRLQSLCSNGKLTNEFTRKFEGFIH